MSKINNMHVLETYDLLTIESGIIYVVTAKRRLNRNYATHLIDARLRRGELKAGGHLWLASLKGEKLICDYVLRSKIVGD